MQSHGAQLSLRLYIFTSVDLRGGQFEAGHLDCVLAKFHGLAHGELD